MRKTGWLMVCGLYAALGMPAWAQQSIAPEALNIEDGDTLHVQVSGVSYRIQLPDIDAPENVVNPKLQRDIDRTGLSADELLPLGEGAAGGLRQLLPMFQPYRLVFDPAVRDRYGRTPGDLVDGHGVALSLRLVEAGWALPSRPADGREQVLQAAAAAAREAGRGLWGQYPDRAKAWATSTGR